MNITPKKRKQLEELIIKLCNEIDPSGLNAEIYTDSFKTMSNENLEVICRRFRVYAPTGSKADFDYERNIKLLRKYGYEPFQHAFLTDPATGIVSRTKMKHLVLPGAGRRQTQAWEKKVAIPEHNRRLDKLTGAVTGSASKGSSFSSPQVMVMDAQGYKFAIRELINTRGGNIVAGRVVDKQIRQFGNSSQFYDGVDNTRVKSSKSLSAFYQAMHIGNTIGK